jgi:hypothetical protein
MNVFGMNIRFGLFTCITFLFCHVCFLCVVCVYYVRCDVLFVKFMSFVGGLGEVQ